MSDAPDPISVELFMNAILSITDRMALTVFRTTYSKVLKDDWIIPRTSLTPPASSRRRG